MLSHFDKEEAKKHRTWRQRIMASESKRCGLGSRTLGGDGWVMGRREHGVVDVELIRFMPCCCSQVRSWSSLKEVDKSKCLVPARYAWMVCYVRPFRLSMW